jgi:hypothetical protein
MRKLQPICIAVICALTALKCPAQLKLPGTDNDLRNNLQKIINDFPGKLSSVRGDTLSVGPQTIEFASLLEFKGAQQSSIVEYRSLHPLYSWQAVLLDTEEFEAAAKKYKWLCNQLKAMSVKMEGGRSIGFTGEYQPADESKKFSSSIFKLHPAPDDLTKLRIEASMQFEFPVWKVNLSVYDKEREDDERGAIKEE